MTSGMSLSGVLQEKRTRVDIPYLDGLRGVAAISVVLYHAFLYTGFTNQSTKELPFVDLVFGWGYLGVPVFIVLSGYVLMLPLLQTTNFAIPRGAWNFIKRRGKRILPPYFAALAISVALILLIPVMQSPAGTQWDTKIPITVSDVLSHVFLVHDLLPASIGKINGPLWSVAVELHIYMLMPLVLLPLWRRFNPGWVVLSVLILTASPIFTDIGEFAHPWLVGLFATGMWAAQLTMSERRPKWIVPVLFVFTGLIPVAIVLTKVLNIRSVGLTEVVVGIAVSAGLVWMGRRFLAGTKTSLARPLESRLMTGLGQRSYSVYLLHSPLLGLANLLLLPLGLPILGQWLVMLLIAVPASVFLCIGFYQVVERRFLNTHQKLAVPT